MECCYEFCLFEQGGNVGGFPAYVVEGGPLMFLFRGVVCLVGCWMGGYGV